VEPSSIETAKNFGQNSEKISWLKPHDHPMPFRFAECAQERFFEDDHFYRKIVFFDEAHFHLGGYVNKQPRRGECRYAHGYLQAKYKKLLQHTSQHPLAKRTTVSYLSPDMACDKQKKPRIYSNTECGMLIRALTGHWLVSAHAGRLKAPQNDFCRSCRDEEKVETVEHFSASDQPYADSD